MNDFVTGRFINGRHAEFDREADRDALGDVAKAFARGAGAKAQPRWPSALAAFVRRCYSTDRRAIAAARTWVRGRAAGGTRI